MLSTLLAILQFYSLPVGFTFFPPSRFYQRTHRPWLYQKSRLNLCDIFYIIMAPQPPCLCFVAALAILWLSQAFRPIPQVLKSRSPRQKLLKQISLTLLTFPCAPRGSFLFFSPSFFFLTSHHSMKFIFRYVIPARFTCVGFQVYLNLRWAAPAFCFPHRLRHFWHHYLHGIEGSGWSTLSYAPGRRSENIKKQINGREERNVGTRDILGGVRSWRWDAIKIPHIHVHSRTQSGK